MLRPFFPYYGSKWRSARMYGPPTLPVIEPFAGSAGYATYWGVERALLIDIDEIIIAVWNYLIRASEAEIMRLPDLEVGEDVRSLGLLQEQEWLIGFWLNRGSAQPKRSRTAYSARTERAQLVWSQRARERIASQLHGIRDWRAQLGDYTSAPGSRATWFIDPPYVVKGRFYRHGKVDYALLAPWCRSRSGTTIVCENAGADWLPFEPLATIKSTRGTSVEVAWRG